jgi:Molybdopterin biosynthesis enzyme
MKAVVVHRGAQDGDLAGRVLCHDIRGHRNEIVFRKGHALRVEDLAVLSDAPWTEIHLIELGPDDFGQREAGQRLASSLSSDGLQSAPSGHRHVLKARHNGLVRIDVEALHALNSVPGIAVYTLLNDQVAAKDQFVAEAQITPLAIDRRSIEAATEIAGEGGNVIRLLPFVPRDVVFWMRDDRHLSDLAGKLHWFGCPVREVVDLPRQASAIRESMERRAGLGATLFLVSGSNALDPLDPVFAAIESLGAKMQRIGMPMHPGTLLWIAKWRDITIIGLPTCGLGTQVTSFDLILPKLLAEGGIRDEELAALGHGGILSSRRSEGTRDSKALARVAVDK